MYTFRETCAEDATLEMGDETTKIFLNSKGKREGIDSDPAAFLDYIEGKAPKGKFTETIADVPLSPAAIALCRWRGFFVRCEGADRG